MWSPPQNNFENTIKLQLISWGVICEGLPLFFFFFLLRLVCFKNEVKFPQWETWSKNSVSRDYLPFGVACDEEYGFIFYHGYCNANEFGYIRKLKIIWWFNIFFCIRLSVSVWRSRTFLVEILKKMHKTLLEHSPSAAPMGTMHHQS